MPIIERTKPVIGGLIALTEPITVFRRPPTPPADWITMGIGVALMALTVLVIWRRERRAQSR